MKTREAFERIRKRRNRFSLRVRLVLVVAAEILISILISFGISELMRNLFPSFKEISPFTTMMVISLLVGIFVTGFMSRYFFDPIKKLREAMEQIADGDFSVRLETKSSSISSKEVQEVYSGFNLMAHELSSTEMLQSDFVSNVSHEIKTPINAIEGYATLLQGYAGADATEREYIEKILLNTERLSSLIGNILLLSKIENQSIETKQATFSLDEQIRQSIVALEASWSDKNIEFDADMERIEYYGSEGLMHHVWDNLIGNAIKFSPQNGKITVSLKRDGKKIIFTVDDCGEGISDNAKKHIFDKFYQGDSSHKQEGNGLGLALVKRILMITGGEISAENLIGGGCRFTVILNEK